LERRQNLGKARDKALGIILICGYTTEEIEEDIKENHGYLRREIFSC
jgi:hypothetical protein